MAALVLWIVLPAAHSTPQVSLNYTQFQSKVIAHQVKSINLGESGQTSTGVLTDGKHFTTVVPAQAGSSLLTELQNNKVQITAAPTGASFGSEVLSWAIILLPLLLFGFIWYRLSRNAAGGGGLQGIMGVGRSRAKVFDAERPSTRFSDVAGYDGAKREISEVVDFLKNADRYKAVGAVPPRGVLMVGPPGTGKTLIARAVAGEAEVPFFSVAGSSFVELFVGVGAARVRDLFSEARKRAPCIIFVDEIDAIGQRRSGGQVYASNDEREQTLNQLLSEMDGFDPATGIVVLAATNRPEVLDPALLRPGRFDRQVTIPLPNVSERAAILAVHCRGKQVAPDVDLNTVARGTPGFSGADLANLVNEAAIFAVRAGRNVITAVDFDAARDRILLGRREDSNVLLPEEKKSVAVHEAGHAMVAALSPQADPVAKVTILPAGQALGVTEQLPLVERHLYSEEYLHQSLAVRLGGRAAELVKFNHGVHRGLQRPGLSHRSGHPDGAGVRPVPRARPGRLPGRRVDVPRRGRRRVFQPAVLRVHPGRDRPRGVPAATGGRAAGGQPAEGPRGPARPAVQPAAGPGDRGRRDRVRAARHQATGADRRRAHGRPAPRGGRERARGHDQPAHRSRRRRTTPISTRPRTGAVSLAHPALACLSPACSGLHVRPFLFHRVEQGSP